MSVIGRTISQGSSLCLSDPLSHGASGEVPEGDVSSVGEPDYRRDVVGYPRALRDRFRGPEDGRESYPRAVWSPPEAIAGTDCSDLQEYHGSVDLSPLPAGETSSVGRGVLVRRLLRGDSRGTGQLVCGRALRQASRSTQRRLETIASVLKFADTPQLAAGSFISKGIRI